jgi:AbiU2
MSRDLTAEEAKNESINLMGKPLGEVYHYLWQELVMLYAKWFEFTELFGTKPSRINLLNEAAPYFFRMVQDVLWEDIILGIARITDSSKRLGKDNLTINKIPGLINNEEFKEKIVSLIDKSKDATSFCRDWRNRRLAHLDLLLRTERGTKELEIASRVKTKTALDSIAEVINAVSSKYNDSTTAFEYSGNGPGNALSLLYVLYDGLKADKEREKRIEEGNELEADFNHPDI